MAIDPHRPTERDCFVRQEKKFYPQKLHLGHDQLKHFVNCPQTGRVYLVDRRNIYCIDTEKSKRTLVAELPFEARCTATGYGWICVGGKENGYFASVRIPDGAQDNHRGVRDARSASNIEETHRDYWERLGLTMPPHIKIERLGEQLINSISIHGIERTDGKLEVVALVTNNDQSVRIWSLTYEVELDFEAFPFPMNHATISPDGKLLVVVGDKEWAYLYRRLDRDPTLADQGSLFHWERIRDLALHKPPGPNNSEYFTTAWSPNGRLLATASQQGYITVFDVSTLIDLDLDRDPVVALIASSRASTHIGPGAVRTMCFAPDPWDLLLWTENNGRLGVGDLRTGLMTRQIVDLDPTAGVVQRVELTDAGSFMDHHERPNGEEYGAYQSILDRLERTQSRARDGGAHNALVRDYSAALLQERRHEQPNDIGLSEEEWQRLDMLRTTRQQEEAIRRGLDADTSHVRTPLPLPQSVGRDADAPSRQTVHGSGRIDSPSRSGAFMESIRNYARDHPDSISAVTADRSATSHAQQARRRRSVISSNTGADSPSTPSAADSDPWRTIEAAIARAGAVDEALQGDTDDDMPGFERATPSSSNMPHADLLPLSGANATVSLPRPWERGGSVNERADFYLELLGAERQERQHLQRQQARARTADEDLRHIQARQRIRQRERELSSTATLTRQIGLRLGPGPEPSLRQVVGEDRQMPRLASLEDGLETTGVAWDEGRRVVYAGTVAGVFELKMNFAERKFWPSVQMR